jgi:uncharacterized membrane protein
MVRFRSRDWLDHVFKIGIILKGIDGLLEVVGGVLLLLVTRAEISGLVRALTQHELSQDPRDLIASQLLHTADSLTSPGLPFAAGYLLVHGIVKVVLVLALLRKRIWVYPWLIGMLLIFIGYQVYRSALSPTPGLIALTGFDIAIVALTWREYQRGTRLPCWPGSPGLSCDARHDSALVALLSLDSATSAALLGTSGPYG